MDFMMNIWMGAAVLGVSGLVIGASFEWWTRRWLQKVSDEIQASGVGGEGGHRITGLVAGGTAALFLIVGWRYGWSGETLVGAVLAAFLLPLALIDLKMMLLPDALTLTLLGMMFALRGWLGPEPWVWYVIGGGLGAGMLLLLAWLSPILFGKEGMGLGDVKLMAAIGMATGLDGAILTLFFASLAGIVFGLVYRRFRLGQPNNVSGSTTGTAANADLDDDAFPFGPALALGGFLAFLFGDDVWRAYWSLLV